MQHSMSIANQAGASFRGDLNNAIQSLATNSLGTSAPTTTYPGQWWIDTGTSIDATGGPWARKRNSSNSAWVRMCHADADLISELVGQAYTAFTTGGTSGAFTLTPVPAITGYSGPMRYHVKFHVAGNGSDTINISGQGTKNLKQYDSSGNKVAPVITAGFSTDIFFDGTDVVILDPLPAAQSSSAPTIRQTVLSGPVDSNGYAAFGGSTGSSTLTASGTIKATCGAGGDSNYTGSITNPAWTSPGGSGTGFLFLAITSAGVVSPLVRTLAPVRQYGGAYSTTNDQHTYNCQENTAKVGNGTTSAQVYEVCVGECPYTSGAWSGTPTWYQLRGEYTGAWTNTLPSGSTVISANHNLGTNDFVSEIELKCLTAENSYSVGDIETGFANWRSGVGSVGVNMRKQRNSVAHAVADGGWQGQNISTAGYVAFTAANWAYRFVAKRRG